MQKANVDRKRTCGFNSMWATVALAFVCLTAQTPTHADLPTAALVTMARHNQKVFYGWLNSPWTGDDKPYARLRTKIESGATDAKSAIAAMNRYQAQLAQEPDNFQAQFAYYYAAYWASVLPGGIGPEGALQKLNNLYLDVVRKPHPQTYDYARLVFLCQNCLWSEPHLKAVGLRLVYRDPADYEVTFNVISVLLSSHATNDQAQALTLAEDLAGRYPSNPNVYSRLASVHYSIWQKSGSAPEAQKAIAEYQKYLQLALPTASYRKQAEALVKQLQQATAS